MKRCASCGRTYHGSERFCRDDGSPLAPALPADPVVPPDETATPQAAALRTIERSVRPPLRVGVIDDDAATIVGPVPQEPQRSQDAQPSHQLTPPPFPGIDSAGSQLHRKHPSESTAVAGPAAPIATAPAKTSAPLSPLSPRTSSSAVVPALTLPVRPARVGSAEAAAMGRAASNSSLGKDSSKTASALPKSSPVLPKSSSGISKPSTGHARPVSGFENATPTGKSNSLPRDPAAAATLVTSVDGEDEPEERSTYLGQLIDDRYLVQSLVGRGGMGVVFRCEQVHLKKTMAIKMLHESLVAKKQLIARFTREARAISRLSSPHTVMVYDFGRWGEIFYLVMELLEGEALDATLEREGPLQPDRVARLVLQMCDSLAEAHKHGIIHRDLKPENIMLVTGQAHPDFIKILDFGLAKVQGADDPYTIHSQRDIFGTPYFMSPEQIRAGEIDGRADIYAVGALMFRMLTGQHVFQQKNTFDILKAHLMEPPPAMAHVVPELAIPASLESLVAKALAKDPDERFQTMEELSQALVAGLRSGWKESSASAAKSAASKTPSGKVAPAKQAPVGNPLDGPTVQTQPPTALRPASDAVELDEKLSSGGATQRRKVTAFFATLVAALLALAGGVWWSMASPSTEEQEPNDEPGRANPLGPGNTAEGRIGKRHSDSSGDRDCFRLPTVPEGQELAIHVTGVPTMDVALALHNDSGRVVLTHSHSGKGQGELLRLPAPNLNPRVVCLGELVVPGQIPGESLSDRYTLKITVQVRSLHSESEPNDDRPGNELQPNIDHSAALDGPTDRDVFNMPGSIDGRLLKVHLEVAPGQEWANLRLALLDSKQRMIAARNVIPGELKPVLAFVGAAHQQPDVALVHRVASGAAELRADPVLYTLRYQITDAAEQSESEPNNTEDSAQPMVLGAWHHGDMGDSAAIDWLRIDGGDPSMKQIRIEAAASAGPYLLTVRDLGRNGDLRQLVIAEGAPKEVIISNGSGEGYLLKATPTDAIAKRREAGRWRLRARVFTGD